MRKRYKIYCAQAIRGDARFSEETNLPHVLENIPGFSDNFETRSEKTYSNKYKLLDFPKTADDVFVRDFRWLNESRAVIAEISGESTGTGWEICLAQHILYMPVLCLLRNGIAPSIVVGGNTHKNIYLATYSSLEELKIICRSFLECLLITDDTARNQALDNESLIRSRIEQRLDASNKLNKYFSLNLRRKKNLSFGVALSGLRDLEEANLADSFRDIVSRPELSKWSARLTEINLDETSLNTLKRSFRGVVEWVSKSNGVVFDVSVPSTDLGWLVCYAQVKRKLLGCTYQRSSKVSYMILGNPSAYDKILREPHQDSEVLSKTDHKLHRAKTLENIVSIKGYDSPDDWMRYTSDFVTKISDDLESGLSRMRIGEHLQGFFAPSGEFRSRRESPWRYSIDIRKIDDITLFLVRAILLNDRWNRKTRQGFTGTFISGERAKLIASLPRYDRRPRSIEVYVKEKNWIGYEERALAKNIRALKDIGLLVKLPSGGSLISAELEDGRRIRMVVPKSIVLSDYCLSLSDFLTEYDAGHLVGILRRAPKVDGLERYDRIDIDDDASMLMVPKEQPLLGRFIISEARHLQSLITRGRSSSHPSPSITTTPPKSGQFDFGEFDVL